MTSFATIYANNINKTCMVYSDTNPNNYASGNLLWYSHTSGTENLYCITAKHNLDFDISNYFSTIVNINMYNASTSSYEITTKILTFICIGYDTCSDICVGLYRPDLNLDQNGTEVVYKSTDRNTTGKNYLFAWEISDIIDPSVSSNIGDAVCIIGQNKWDNETFSVGSLKDNAYSGKVGSQEMTECILLDIATYKGSSGAPVISSSQKIIGLINGGFDKYYDHISFGISGRILSIVIIDIIQRFFELSTAQRNSDIYISNYTNKGFIRNYLGIKNYQLSHKHILEYRQLKSVLSSVGGIFIEGFVVGINPYSSTYELDSSSNQQSISIINPFEFNTRQITLSSEQTIYQIADTNAMTVDTLKNINNFGDKLTISSGTVINIINYTDKRIWNIYHKQGKSKYPILMTHIWFVKDKVVNGTNVGEWCDIALGKYKGQSPLSRYSYECSNEIEQVGNNWLYKFRAGNVGSIVNSASKSISGKKDLENNNLQIGDIIVEFYYTVNGASWSGPNYDVIKPFVIFPTINGQNQSANKYLSIQTPSVIMNYQKSLLLESYSDYPEDYIEKYKKV